MSPFEQGRADFDKGYKRDDNPFHPKSTDGVNWAQGWFEAFEKADLNRRKCEHEFGPLTYRGFTYAASYECRKCGLERWHDF